MMDSQRQDERTRIRSEAEFHDARINTPDEHRLSYAYASVADVYEFCAAPLERVGGTILEIGCFRGDQASALAAAGFRGRYLGIDISPAAIAHCRSLGLPPNFEFHVEDANSLGMIEAESIDYAFGNGVLHHLELPRFAPALAARLSMKGFAHFVEPAQGNLLLRAFRKLTPKLRTPDEYPFDAAAIALLEGHFDVWVRHQALMRPCLPMLFMNSKAVTRASRWIDDRLLRHRIFQNQSWLLQIELGKGVGAHAA